MGFCCYVTYKCDNNEFNNYVYYNVPIKNKTKFLKITENTVCYMEYVKSS